MIENGLSSLKIMYLFSIKGKQQGVYFGGGIVSPTPEETLTGAYFQTQRQRF